MQKIVIFGVGLIGGSLALALKQAGLIAQLVGVGRSAASLQSALALGVIDAAETHVKLAVIGADIIVIAAPVAQTPIILQAIYPYLEPRTVITDVGSTKTDIVQYAQTILHEKAPQFVPAHPIAGAEKSGVAAAKADLFIGKNIVLTPSEHTHKVALNTVRDLWLKTGAHVVEMSAENHDAVFAAVSHLPHLLAFALVNEFAARPNAQQLFNFAASGFRDFTRIAGSNPEMWRDISLANRTALLAELAAYQAALTQLQQLLTAENGAGLEALFTRASIARNHWAKAH